MTGELMKALPALFTIIGILSLLFLTRPSKDDPYFSESAEKDDAGTPR